ncbi:MAG: hypothetical protein ACWA5Q_09430 [bacterium]
MRNLLTDWRFVLAVLLVGTWWLTREPTAIKLGPGVLAPLSPVQMNLESAASFDLRGHQVTPLATFDIHAKVLSRENYRWDRGAELSPVDFALGWGKMSDEAVLANIDIRQSNRWYHWRTDAFPIPRSQIEHSSANMHMIPRTSELQRLLSDVRTGQLVRIKGYLVNVVAKDGWKWKSSLTREDTGNGSCELILVESLEIEAG